MNIIYTVKRSRKRRKTISLQISDKSGLIVSAPYFTPVGEIIVLCRKNKTGLTKRYRNTKKNLLKIKPKNILPVKCFIIWGNLFHWRYFLNKMSGKALFFGAIVFILTPLMQQKRESSTLFHGIRKKRKNISINVLIFSARDA